MRDVAVIDIAIQAGAVAAQAWIRSGYLFAFLFAVPQPRFDRFNAFIIYLLPL